MKDKQLLSVLIAMASFTTWGLVAIYWKQLDHINPIEILAFRGVFGLFFAGLFVIFMKEGLAVYNTFKNRKMLLTMIASSIMIACNWGIYIWAVSNGKITETSLGYYLNPLFNVLASALIFKTHMNKIQMFSIFLVCIGVANLLIGYGSIPFIALSIAGSFCIYGVIRKIAPIGTFPGLFIETLFVAIPSSVYLLYLYFTGTGTFLHASGMDMFLIVVSGIVTTVPLAGFAYAAKNLPLSTVGIIQYLSPTISFCVGVFMYKETFTFSHFITFLFIWIALLIYTTDGVIHYRKTHKH